MKTMELVVNSRPDANGEYWLMLSDPGVADGYDWAGRIARYFTSNHTFGSGSTVRVDAGIYVGIRSTSAEHMVTTIVRRTSEFFTGHPLQARFWRADDVGMNAGPSNVATVGPVLSFRIDTTDRAR